MAFEQAFQHLSMAAEKTTWRDIPADLQSLVFALSATPLTTCKASAAVACSPHLTATWLLSSKQELPLLTAARHQLWDACIVMLDSKPQRRAYELHYTLALAADKGATKVVEVLLQEGAWAEWLWEQVHPSAGPAFDAWLGKVWAEQLQGGVESTGFKGKEEAEALSFLTHPLTAAARRGHLDICTMILSHKGKDIAPLYIHWSMCAAAEAGQVGVVRLLLDKGAIVKTWVEPAWPGHSRLTGPLNCRSCHTCPILAAASGGNPEVLHLLITKGTAMYRYWHRSLVQAVACGHVDTVRVLLTDAVTKCPELCSTVGRGLPGVGVPARGGGVQGTAPASDHQWEAEGLRSWAQSGSPLGIAAMNGSTHLVQLLLESKLEVGSKEDALTQAAKNGHVEVLRLLLSHGADVMGGLTFHDPHTPLAEATSHRHSEAADVLLDAWRSTKRPVPAMTALYSELQAPRQESRQEPRQELD
jgi:hypothetical protein